MFRIDMLPAREGDCLVVTYGEANAPRRILIDGGRKGTYADLKGYLAALPPAHRHFELLIVSHVDRDHIEGILSLFADPDAPATFRDVWFNGYHHLHDGAFETFSPVQGEVLTEALVGRVRQDLGSWNGAFGANYKQAVALAADESPVDVELDGGMRLTLLSPSREKLAALIPQWEKSCRDAGIVAGQAAREPAPEGFEFFAAIDIDALADEPFEPDATKPNGSSVAVLATYGDKRALLAADAHADLLEASVNRLRDGTRPIDIDAFKIPHHGSRKNLSSSLLQMLRCRHYLVSTSGSYFKHPDPVAISRIIKYGGPDKHLWFNYRSDETQLWDVPSWREEWDYTPHYPAAGAQGFQSIEL